MCWSCKSNTHINYSGSPLIQLEFSWQLLYRAQLSRQALEGSHLGSIRNTTEAKRRANKDRQIFRALNLCLDVSLKVYMQQISLNAVKHTELLSSSSFPFSNKSAKSQQRIQTKIYYILLDSFHCYCQILEDRDNNCLCSWRREMPNYNCDGGSGYWRLTINVENLFKWVTSGTCCGCRPVCFINYLPEEQMMG